MELRKFKSSELAFTQQEAWQVLVFFFGGNASSVPGWMTDNDRSFAQALLVEAIDKSYAMSWMQAILRVTVNPPTSLRAIFGRLARKAARDWFNEATLSDLKNPRIYLTIKNQLTLHWRTAWEIRIQTGDPVY